MAFGVDAVSGDSSSSAADLTFTHVVGASANLLLVGIGVGDGAFSSPGILSVTYNGVAMTLVAGSAVDDGNWAAARWYRLDNPATGSHSVVVDADGTIDQLSAHAISFIDASLTLGTPSTNTGTSTNPSVTVADSANGNTVVSLLVDDNSSGDTAAGGTSIADIEDLQSDTDHNSQYQTASGANTVCSWTNSGSGSGWAASGLAVKAAGGGGGTYNAVPLLDHYYRMIGG